MSVNGATVECMGDNAAISSGEPAGSYYHYKYGDGGKLVVENCTIKNSKYGIYLGRGSSTSAELKSAEFEGTESDIYLESDKEITISDTFTTQTTIKVATRKKAVSSRSQAMQTSCTLRARTRATAWRMTRHSTIIT